MKMYDLYELPGNDCIVAAALAVSLAAVLTASMSAILYTIDP